jgi:hypothetical protein
MSKKVMAGSNVGIGPNQYRTPGQGIPGAVGTAASLHTGTLPVACLQAISTVRVWLSLLIRWKTLGVGLHRPDTNAALPAADQTSESASRSDIPEL